MCTTCDFIGQVFQAAKMDALANYRPVRRLLEEMTLQKRIELFAGDCPLDEADDTIWAETHYTVCHYFRCCRCGTYAFVGVCVRGTPIFKLLDESQFRSEVSNRLWGKVGSYFTAERR